MAKISELPVLADPTGLETVVVQDGDTTRRVGLDALAAPFLAEGRAIVDRRDILPCDAEAALVAGSPDPNRIVLRPRPGYRIAPGSELRLAFVVPRSNTRRVDIDVVGFTDGDIRQLRLPDFTQVPAGLLRQDSYCEVKFLPAIGHFALVSPAPVYSSYVQVTQVNVDPSFFQCEMPAATVLQPGVPTFLLRAPADRQGGEHNGVVLEVAGFNDNDPRQVVYPDGSQIGAYAWRADQRLTFHLDQSTGLFVMTDPAPPASALAIRSMTDFYAAMNHQTAALAALGR